RGAAAEEAWTTLLAQMQAAFQQTGQFLQQMAGEFGLKLVSQISGFRKYKRIDT
ncbi:MAG: hypothetical protein HQM04_19325, partial [Magnetococcales bacterium]|nr:hypothetical protein [Magnetococcales bacterium]